MCSFLEYCAMNNYCEAVATLGLFIDVFLVAFTAV
jgi:hypothetical protein